MKVSDRGTPAAPAGGGLTATICSGRRFRDETASAPLLEPNGGFVVEEF